MKDITFESAATKMTEMIDELSTTYLTLIKGGIPQITAMESLRDNLMKSFKLSKLQAANFTRIVVAFAGASIGQQVYSEEGLKEIIKRAF